MSFQYHKLTLGRVATNCYILGDPTTRSAVVIDPAAQVERILAVLKDENWTVREILITHAHFDHVLALGDLKAATGATIKMHRADAPLLEALPEQMQRFFNTIVPAAPAPDIWIDEGDSIAVDGIRLEIRFTPGHAPGHVIFVAPQEEIVFGGDCLFEGSVGRTDLPGGDHATLMQSIFGKIMTLPGHYTVAPGHGELTTIDYERDTNLYLLDWLAQHR